MSCGNCATVFKRYVMFAADSGDESYIFKDTFEFSIITFFNILNSDKKTALQN